MKTTPINRITGLKLFIFLGIISCKPSDSGYKSKGIIPVGYTLVWADEFNQDGQPNSANWVYEQGFVRNNERQWYQPDNAWCENGLLIIEGRKEQKPNPYFEAGSTNWRKARQTIEYTSASLQTRGLHQWKYGRLEMRGRIDTRPGLWPAFWTLGSNRAWPAGGEMDIMEYYRGMLLANLIYGGGDKGQVVFDDLKKPITDFPADWSARFHVWRLEWDEQKVQIYVDDLLLKEVSLSKTFNKTPQNELGANPYREPHYILLNLAIGGDQGGGRQGESLPGGDPSQTYFPARFEIDYVRVYQKTN